MYTILVLRKYSKWRQNIEKTQGIIFSLPLNILHILVCVNINTFVDLFK